MLKRTIDVIFILLLLAILATPLVYRYRIAPTDGRMTLEEFQPRTHLMVDAHPVERARFPVIATGVRLGDDGAALAEHGGLLAELGVETVVSVEPRGVWGDRLAGRLARYGQTTGYRALAAANVDLRGIDRPDFGERVVGQLEAAQAAGARALMVSNELGLELRDGKRRLVRIDDARLDPLWRRSGELGLPVLIESGAPSAYWLPVDRHNERFQELQARPVEGAGGWTSRGPTLATVTGVHAKLDLIRKPELLQYFTWHWSGDFYPTKEALIAQRDAVIERHPETTFVAVGIAAYPEALAFVSGELDRHPNLYVDLTGAYSELGRQPYGAREFLLRHQDRILFGMEGPPSAESYRTAFRFLETRDEYFSPPRVGGMPHGGWMICGMGLPDEALERIYHANAARVFQVDSVD